MSALRHSGGILRQKADIFEHPYVRSSGVITDGISRDLAHALNVGREFGLGFAELQYVWGKEVGDHDKAELAKIKSLIADYGMKVPCITRHIFTGGTLTMSTKITDEIYQK